MSDIVDLGICYFEDYEFCVPNNIDAYLTTEFGNWQEGPQNI